MWTGNVARTERNGNQLNIIISYTNGVDTFDETLTTDKAQNETWLSEQILARLNQLNSLDAYQASLAQDSLLTDAVDLSVADVQSIIDVKVSKIDVSPVSEESLGVN